MSFKEFSSAHSAPAKGKAEEKSKDAPTGDRPGTQPDKTSAEITPASKS
jgi:hypothetical protein